MVLKLYKVKKFRPLLLRIFDILVSFKKRFNLLYQVDQGDEISRYVLSKKHLDKSNPKQHQIHWKCYVPQTTPGREISVYLTSGLSRDEIWSIGKSYVADIAKKSLHGRAYFKKSAFDSSNVNKDMEVGSYPYPHKNHLNIYGDFSSSKKLLCYIKLASISSYDPN